MHSMANPVLVNNLRGAQIESRHRGRVAVCDPHGKSILERGDVTLPVYPRSAIKPLQALPLIESGAADHFALGDADIALACSSHSAEAMHTGAIRDWLARIDLDEDSLECGPHPPYNEAAAAALIRAGEAPGRIHNNCSGKHTAMLTTCRFLGEETRGYIEFAHPAQQRWFDVLGEFAGVDMQRLPAGLDGCGIPVIAIPLQSIATAFARFAAPDDLAAPRRDAIERIADAIAAHPLLIDGSGRFCSEIMALTGRRVLVKGGADGVFTAAIPEQGLGIALKVDDGNGEAAEIALLAVLEQLGSLRPDELEALEERRRKPIRNTRGVVAGYREPASPEND